MKPPGVGLVFVPELLPLLRDEGEAVSVVEIEPQTLWQLSRSGGRERYLLNAERCRELAELPQTKLLHSVGLPFASSRPLDAAQTDLLWDMVGILEPPWVSDHLSFNAFAGDDGWTSAGFLLPPRQDADTVAVAAAKIRAFGERLGVPVAFETGVNYLRPAPGEMADGEFFAAVAEAADCGILLDLHNLWANERNGRTPAREVLARLPLDRVWEVHLAGGMGLDGYWLDAHSGPIPEPVVALAAEWIPRLPNLGALVFEILGEHVASLGLQGVRCELSRLRALWALRPPAREVRLPKPPSSSSIRPADPTHVAAVTAWETTLGALAIGGEAPGPLAETLDRDPGIAVLRQLVTEARAGFITQGLRHTMTLLVVSLGVARTRELLARFMRSRTPELFVSAEADAFARFLRAENPPIPYLDEVLAFEHALVRAMLYDEETTLRFTHEPTALFDALEQGRLPHDVPVLEAALVVRSG